MGDQQSCVILLLLSFYQPVTMVSLKMASFTPTSCYSSQAMFRITIDSAVSKIIHKSLPLHLNVSNTVYDSCLPATALESMAAALRENMYDVIVGPGCLEICDSARSLASHYKILTVSWICPSPPMESSAEDIISYTATVPPPYSIVSVIATILTYFQWKHVQLISINQNLYREAALELHAGMSRSGFIVDADHVITGDVTTQEITGIVAKKNSQTQVVILTMDDERAHVVLNGIAASDVDLTTLVVLVIRTHSALNVTSDLLMANPFSAVSVSSSRRLTQVLHNTMLLQAHGQSLLNESGDSAQPYEFSSFQEYLHDAVTLALSARLSAADDNEVSPTAGAAARLMNRTVPGLHGPVEVDACGRVQYTFSLWDYDERLDFFTSRLEVKDGAVTVSDAGIMWFSGKQPIGNKCEFEKCTGLAVGALAAILIVSLAFVLAVVLASAAIRRRLTLKELTKGPNKILLHTEDLIFVHSRATSKSIKSMKSMFEKPDLLKGSIPSLSNQGSGDMVEHSDTARYKGDLVFVKELHIKEFEIKSTVRSYLKQLRDMRQENVNAFLGCFVHYDRPGLVWEYCTRRSLDDVIHNDNIKLDWDFKLSLINDLVKGIRYIHTSPIRLHGRLKSGNCVIDSRWVLKVSDYGVHGMYQRYPQNIEPGCRELLWTAPELIRDKQMMAAGSQKADIYSFSIVMQEIVLRSPPFSMLNLDANEIIAKLMKPPPLCRPSVSQQAAPPQYIQLMKQCWAEQPDMRPDCEQLYQQFKEFSKGKKTNIVDTMFRMLEKYSTDLEDIVRERTVALEEEKKKTENLLTQMLPRSVAESLLQGKPVEAESYEDVTIYFSDIVGFTTISAASTPMQVVQLLNDLYTMFDATIDDYDVYKVETIGDAYMVVSGLPNKNGKRHAGEISMMALNLLSQCGQFKMRHMPDVPMRLRIGLHTGSCVAGVVGLRMPRYCLFGDTVNTASRMESTGTAYCIHISQQTKQRLDELGGYFCTFRGEVELKGKGIHKTYWLVGKEGFNKPLPQVPDLDDSLSSALICNKLEKS